MRKRKPTLSKHSVTRAKQRLGHTKMNIVNGADRAMKYGLRVNQTHGALHAILRCKSRKGLNPIYYANAIYLFSRSNVLVTVLDQNTLFDKDLYKYVDYPTYIQYKQNRYIHCKDPTQLNQDLAIGNQFYIDKINEMLSPTGVTLSCIDCKEGSYSVKLKLGEQPPDYLILRELMDRISSEFNVSVSFVSEAHPLSNEELIELKQQIHSWFIRKGIICNIKGIPKQFVQLIVPSEEVKKKVEDKYSESFKKEFKLPLNIIVKEYH